MRCLSLAAAILVSLLFTSATAQAQVVEAPASVNRGAVVGVVFDSLRSVPLARAIVQLVRVDSGASYANATVADELGRFSFDAVAVGTYAVGFFGSLLDSLGVDPTLQAVQVIADATARVELHVPSAAGLRTRLCQDVPAPDTRGMVIGQVRRADSRAPASGADVVASWFEVTLDDTGIRSGQRQRAASAMENGWFVLCDAAAAGALQLSASLAADSTDVVAVEITGSGLLRRDLYVGRVAYATRRAAGVAPAESDTAVHLRTGPGTLSGQVRTAPGGQPLASARVSVANGVEAQADARGAWTLNNAPSGTRILDVRAVGYLPVRLAVDVIDSAPLVEVTLPSLRSVLDSVRVVAARNRSANLRGFDEREKSEASGRFLRQDDVQKIPSDFISDVIGRVPGISLERNPDGTQRLGMRQALTRGRCTPDILIDGALMLGLTLNELNGFIRKPEVHGIEVYPSAHVPPQFQRFERAGLNGCGAVLVWTK